MGREPLSESLWISCLQEDRARAGEPTDQAFAGGQVGDQSAARRTLEDVLAIPRNEMAVVDNISFARLKLRNE